MKIGRLIQLFLIFISATFVESCIHEYPKGLGNDPTKLDLGIEFSFDLKWKEMIHHVEWSTRARMERSHRFIMELSRNDNILGRDTVYLSDEEFALGSYRHKFSLPVSASYYQVAAWYDRIDIESGLSPFNTDDFNSVTLNYSDIKDSEKCYSAFASDYVDLTEFRNQKGASTEKEIEFFHAGAAFRIETGDFKEFLKNQKEALNQGDTYRLRIDFSKGTPCDLNLYNGKANHNIDLESRSGELVLPFSNAEEMVIAEGFCLTDESDNVTMTLTVFNSAQMIVSKTDAFTFPVKRGYITTVKGDFLTGTINNSITINHIWEGEITVELDI